MKNKIRMLPDYGNALFWDDDGCCIGSCTSLFIEEEGKEIEVKLDTVKRLVTWYNEWETESLYQTHQWTDLQWKQWWQRGLDIAKNIKQLLPKNVELHYFSLEKLIWRIRPENSDDGGLFNICGTIVVL
mgnify:CR=1 FL=1